MEPSLTTTLHGETEKVRQVQGGDRAAGNASFACGSCVHKDGICFRCLGKKKNWTKQVESDAAIRRTAVLQSVLAHVDPRPKSAATHALS